MVDFEAAGRVVVSGEATPLLGGGASSSIFTSTSTSTNGDSDDTITLQQRVWKFLEAKTPRGAMYEKFMIFLILTDVLAFIVGSVFVEPYNESLGYSWAIRGSDESICNNFCDAIWFGNHKDNGLGWLGIGSTSLLELFTIAVFTVEYILRVWVSPLEGYSNPVTFVLTDFFSWVDLASTLPFYLDAFVFSSGDYFGATGFLRMFRLFRMARVEGGRYNSALNMCGAVYRAQKAILGTAAFVGVTTWISVSSLYYLVERRNPDMIYCGHAPEGFCDTDPDDIDTSLCAFDSWGIVDCTLAGCPGTEEVPEPCYNLYQSIPMASYFSLLNLFGEFPLFDQHSTGGQIVGTVTSLVAVFIFALPVGIIGNGFETEIDKRRKNIDESPIVEGSTNTLGFVANDGGSLSSSLYNFYYHSESKPGKYFEHLINFLVVGTALTFMIDTIDELPDGYRLAQSYFEFFAVLVFTAEYGTKIYATVVTDPKYATMSLSSGLWNYATTFLPFVDLLGFLPYWIVLFGFGGQIIDISGPSDGSGTFVKALRLLRIFRFEKYTHAFLSFDDIFTRNADVLGVTFFSSVLLWVFFGALLYMTERDNPDPEMASNYNSVPNSMWMTLLNLSGEAPLAQYSLVGKIATGILGLFATAIFGIPIGILGGGFEAVVEEETEDDDREISSTGTKNGTTATATTMTMTKATNTNSLNSNNNGATPTFGTDLEKWCYSIVTDKSSAIAETIETLIFVLIFVAITIGAWNTVKGHEDDFSGIEALTVCAFTLEYIVRLIGVGADPILTANGTSNGFVSRLRYVFSFYSIIDLLAILPYYLALALPESIIDQYDEYLRMARILRLLTLDKHVPSFSLIDDVIRYKWQSMKVAGYAAITLWTIFAGLIYLCEYTDSTNEIDPVPLHSSCTDDCTMMDRFQNYFDSFYFVGIHLTGDYPITTYDWPAKIVNFFMVVSAVGVVSIPSGLIANGFVEIVQSKNKAKNSGSKDAAIAAAAAAADDDDAVEGDDWYEVEYRALKGVPPPDSPWGPTMDYWQTAVNEFLNGTKDASGKTQHTPLSLAGRIFIFAVIILNIIAVIVESVPTIDRDVGNKSGNFFDKFETLSIAVFSLEYVSRLFCAPKNRESLYSSWVYAHTFFGIVDFLSTAPWYIEQILVATGTVADGGDAAMVFRIFRIVRLLQLEDFLTAFSKLDNVFRASMGILKSTILLALIIWVGGGSLFFILERNNPNFRECHDSIPSHSVTNGTDLLPGCYDFESTDACIDYYGDGMCDQKVFVNLPNTLYMTAVFLGGEWGVTDFTWPGKILCILFCYVGIALYAIPAGTLFDKFGGVLGLDGNDEDDEEEE